MKLKPYQFRIDPKEPREAELLKKLQKASEATALSMNQLAALAVAAGLPAVVTSLSKLHDPEGHKQAA